jgi:hypothetical protein
MHAYLIHIFSFLSLPLHFFRIYGTSTLTRPHMKIYLKWRALTGGILHVDAMLVIWLATGHRLLVHNCPCGNMYTLGSDGSNNMLEQTFSHHLLLDNTPTRGDPSLVPPMTTSTRTDLALAPLEQSVDGPLFGTLRSVVVRP